MLDWFSTKRQKYIFLDNRNTIAIFFYRFSKNFTFSSRKITCVYSRQICSHVNTLGINSMDSWGNRAFPTLGILLLKITRLERHSPSVQTSLRSHTVWDHTKRLQWNVDPCQVLMYIPTRGKDACVGLAANSWSPSAKEIESFDTLTIVQWKSRWNLYLAGRDLMFRQ